MINKLGEIRPGQLITTFGPGAILDSVKDSVVILDTNYWKNTGRRITDARLASYLGVDYFLSPRTSFKEDLPVVSFPNYHICSSKKCNRLFDIRDDFELEKYLKFGPTCPDCGKPAYPARFIVSCKDGHLDDFPWKWWVHHGETNCTGKMKLISTGNTSSLGDLKVICECGDSRSMTGATEIKNFSGFMCTGRYPHRPGKKEYNKCKKGVVPLQRGASNVYFPVLRSAISIPPWINPLYSLIDEHYKSIKDLREYLGEDADEKVYDKHFKPKYSFQEFKDALKRRDDKIKEYVEIKEMEYSAITHFEDFDYKREDYFKAEEEVLPSYLEKYFSRIIKVHRLREVLVLLGFMRNDSPEPEVDEPVGITKLSVNPNDRWLPAVNINGEGIFIEFNKESINKWSDDPYIHKLSKKYTEHYDKYIEEKGWKNAKSKNIVYVLLHTFAHVLIKELSMKCGYSSAAIKERIYFSENMCGVLLYTGSSDKEGSLGGLVEMGRICNFTEILLNALKNSITCTTDPRCMTLEPEKQRINGAACHSCTMISETSCESGNRLLDRCTLLTLSGRQVNGYFDELVRTECGIEI